MLKIKLGYIMNLILISFYRIRHNKDVTIAIVGTKGNGKSTMMLYLAIHAAVLRKYVQKNHTLKIDRDKLSKIEIDFEEDVLKCISWIPSKWVESMLHAPRYTVIGLDEAGNAWNKRRFNEEVNKILNETQQSNRFLGQIKVLTMPHLGDIDTGGKKNCNFYIDMFIQGKGKAYFLATDSFTGKQYRYTLRDKKGRDMILVTSPLPKQMYKLYEKKKHSIEVQRYLDRIARLEEIEKNQSPKSMMRKTVEIAISLLTSGDKDKILTKRGKLNARFLAAKANVSSDIAYKVKALYDAEGMDGLKSYI